MLKARLTPNFTAVRAGSAAQLDGFPMWVHQKRRGLTRQAAITEPC